MVLLLVHQAAHSASGFLDELLALTAEAERLPPRGRGSALLCAATRLRPEDHDVPHLHEVAMGRSLTYIHGLLLGNSTSGGADGCESCERNPPDVYACIRMRGLGAFALFVYRVVPNAIPPQVRVTGQATPWALSPASPAGRRGAGA